MKPIAGYANAQVIAETQKLPVGAYIVGILDVQEQKYDWGDVLVLKFDISEGDLKNFYTDQYQNSQLEDKKYKGNFRLTIPKDDGSDQDQWTLRRFKTSITAIEESNPEFHWDWDETKLIGKTVGMVFQEKEWKFNGKTGFTAQPYCLKSVDDIRKGNFKLPGPKLLGDHPQQDQEDFKELPDTGDLPF